MKSASECDWWELRRQPMEKLLAKPISHLLQMLMVLVCLLLWVPAPAEPPVLSRAAYQTHRGRVSR